MGCPWKRHDSNLGLRSQGSSWVASDRKRAMASALSIRRVSPLSRMPPPHSSHFLIHILTASALRTPITLTSSYPAPFAMMSHHEMNGSLTSPSAYAGLHNIPSQMSAAAAAAAAAYGRSPMVSFGAVRRPFGSFWWGRGLGREWELAGLV